VVGPERLALARNADLHGVPSRRGRFLGPQRLDEAIRRHELAGVRQHIAITTDGQVSLDALLDRDEPALLQPLDVHPRKPFKPQCPLLRPW
jgi:hypothetical protein